MSSEIWKDVVGYEGLYKVSNFGNVVKMPTLQHRISKYGKKFTQLAPKAPSLMRPALDFDGYPTLSLSKNGTSHTYRVHRLVAIAFIDNPDNKPQVNHKNGVKNDNCVDNLEWCTQSENIRHSVDVLGNSIGSPKGSHKSEEQKKKQSEAMSGRVLPEWHREILKKAQNDPENRRKSYRNDPRRFPVKCLEDGKIYASALYASKFYGVSDTAIKAAIKEGRKVKKKWTFVKSDIDPMKENTVKGE